MMCTESWVAMAEFLQAYGLWLVLILIFLLMLSVRAIWRVNKPGIEGSVDETLATTAARTRQLPTIPGSPRTPNNQTTESR